MNSISILELKSRLKRLNLKYETKFGMLSSHWYYDNNDKIHFEFVIPNGVEAQIKLPNEFSEKIGAGKYIYTI